jgi:hypothetical protein
LQLWTLGIASRFTPINKFLDDEGTKCRCLIFIGLALSRNREAFGSITTRGLAFGRDTDIADGSLGC